MKENNHPDSASDKTDLMRSVEKINIKSKMFNMNKNMKESQEIIEQNLPFYSSEGDKNHNNNNFNHNKNYKNLNQNNNENFENYENNEDIQISRKMFHLLTLKTDKLSSKFSSPVLKSISKRNESYSNFSLISNISHYRNDSLQKEQKVFKMKTTNSPYVDLFSKKEIELKLDTNNNDSCDNMSVKSSLYNMNPSFSNLISSSSSSSKRKISISDLTDLTNLTDKTPSFSKQEYLYSLNDEGVEVISITNITKYNIPLPVRNKSFSKEKFLKVPDNNFIGPQRFNSMGPSINKNKKFLNLSSITN
jgi:hypothetical protein